MPSSEPTNNKNDPERIELINFLIEKSKDAKSPLNIKELAREYKETSGSSQQVPCLTGRIWRFRQKIHQMDSIDSEQKVKLLFALGAFIDKDFLIEIQANAHVEVDKETRITKYISHDGSLELEGEHDKSAKAKEGWKRRNALKGLNNSVDGSHDSTPKTPGSVKRAAPEVPNSSKRARTVSVKTEAKDSRPDDSPRILRFRGGEAEHPQPWLQQLKQEEAPEDPGAQKAPNIRFMGPLRALPVNGPLIYPKSEADPALIPQIQLLDAIQSLVLFLGIPPSEIHEKIQQKTDKIGRFTTIQNNEVTLAMELLLARIVNHSVPFLPEKVVSVSLSHFLCYLKAAILNSKLKGLEVLLEKIEEHIREPDAKDKVIPVEKVASALQTTLDVIGF